MYFKYFTILVKAYDLTTFLVKSRHEGTSYGYSSNRCLYVIIKSLFKTQGVNPTMGISLSSEGNQRGNLKDQLQLDNVSFLIRSKVK